MNSGNTSLPISSMDSMVPSWLRGLSSKMISSTPLSSYPRRNSRTVAGERSARDPAVRQSRILLALFEVPFPDSGSSRCVNAGHVVVHDSEGEEAAAMPRRSTACSSVLATIIDRSPPMAEDVRVDLRVIGTPLSSSSL